MKTTTFLKIAGSSLILGVAAVGCTANGGKPASLASKAPRAKAPKAVDAPKAEKQAANLAKTVNEALKARRADKAIPAAEQMVALSPRNASYRALLGQAYLLGGRFQSAGTSFQDALVLDPSNGRAALSMALAQIALGDGAAAHATLYHYRDVIPQADLGLGLALSGDREQAIPLLEAAAHAQGADAKTRQNLALSYALAGRWTEARATAAQDVSPAELDIRMMKWASFANPRASWDQVAMLLNVTPHSDVGQPARLALAPDAAPAAMAEAAPVEAPAPVAEAAPEPAAAQPVAIAEAAPVPAASSETAPLVTVAAADIPASAAPVSYTAPVPAVVAQRPLIEAAPAPVKHAAAPRRFRGSGQYVVQLGAYSNASRVETAWNRVAGRVGVLSGYMPASTTFSSRSATFHRLSIAGFESRGQAVEVCGKVRARGGTCFVRTKAGDAPVQWVSRGLTKLASR